MPADTSASINSAFENEDQRVRGPLTGDAGNRVAGCVKSQRVAYRADTGLCLFLRYANPGSACVMQEFFYLGRGASRVAEFGEFGQGVLLPRLHRSRAA